MFLFILYYIYKLNQIKIIYIFITIVKTLQVSIEEYIVIIYIFFVLYKNNIIYFASKIHENLLILQIS